MKMRVVALFLVLVMTVAALTSCGTTTEAAEKNPFEGRFTTCRSDYSMRVIVDKRTGVCYLCRVETGMTVLLDADGTPLTYEEAWHQTFGGAEG